MARRGGPLTKYPNLAKKVLIISKVCNTRCRRVHGMPRRRSLRVGKVIERVAATFAEYAGTRQQHFSNRSASRL